MKKLFILFIVLLLFMGTAQSVQAHPADMIFHNIEITIQDQRLNIDWELIPGPILVSAFWNNADINRDETISKEEANAWASTQISNLEIKFNDQSLQPYFETVQWPQDLNALQLGDETIHILCHVERFSEFTGENVISITNFFEENISLNWFSITSKSSSLHITSPQQNKNLLTFNLIKKSSGIETSPDKTQVLLSNWDSSTPSISGTVGDTQKEIKTQGSETTKILNNLLKADQLSVGLFLIALLTSLALGGLHALTPGHGKTIVAAYLIGSGGTTFQAIILGVIVTITHTGSVIILGLIAMLASRYILPTDLFPWLELISGLLIIVLGGKLLMDRWREWRKAASEIKETSLKKGQILATKEDLGSSGRSKITIDEPITEFGPKHEHAIKIKPGSEVSWRDIIVLGVSGGLVPCPDAIAILLIAVALNRMAFGMSLIVAFSAGLAVILIAIGLMIVQGRRLFQKLNAITRMAYSIPILSATLVFLLGIFVSFNALDKFNFLEKKQSNETSDPAAITNNLEAFDLSTASILFMKSDSENRYQLYQMKYATKEEIALTHAPAGIQDYVLSPDHSQILYTSFNEEGGYDLWLTDLKNENKEKIIECQDFYCINIQWSSNGERIYFEKNEFPSESNPLGLPGIWWIDLETRKDYNFFEESQLYAYGLRLSADENWVSFISSGSGEVQFYNVETQENFSLVTRAGRPITWHPGNQSFLFTDIDEREDRFLTVLLLYDLKTLEATRITGDLEEDNWANWSADGQNLALTRRLFDNSGNLSLGDYIFVKYPDQKDAAQITNQENFIHGKPNWSPDNAYLLYHRYPLKVANANAEICLLNISTGELEVLVDHASQPVWLP
ncbi:MAG: hypothetical protein JEZ06_01880 [Anaerolineaceae bacterium]|nr:hypothetical protein [Anaerolineaceae bacterium]